MRRPWASRVGRAVLVIGITLLVLAAVGSDVAGASRSSAERERDSAPAFYAAATNVDGTPGTLVESRPMPPPVGARSAWRMVYRSRDEHDHPILVSAVVAVPYGASATHPVLAWAHPTTGASTSCAPSLGTHPFLSIEGSTALLADGYALVATDYPGLGVAGASSYLIGAAEAHAVLDSVLAAERVSSRIGDRVLLWGHSQGGQAALFSAALAGAYAPSLHVLGVAVAAPAADLQNLVSDDLDTLSGTTIMSYAIAAMVPAYAPRFGLDRMRAILTPAAESTIPRMARLCLSDPELHRLARPLVGGLVTADPATTAPWSTVLADNSAPTTIRVPVFIGQGLADQLIDPSTTIAYAHALCSDGTRVTLRRYAHIDHAFAAYASLPAALAWMRRVAAGAEPNACSAVPDH